MTHEELLDKINQQSRIIYANQTELIGWFNSLHRVIELHSPDYDEVNGYICPQCSEGEYWTPYPCITIQAIEKELR